MYLKIKLGSNSTGKSMNNERHDIVRKNDVVTNTDNDDDSAATSLNHHLISTSNTSQQGQELKNVLKKKLGSNSTEKSTNYECDDIVRKNDVVTNSDNNGDSVVSSPNKRDVPTSTKYTSQQGDKLENESQKEVVENWSDKIRKFITTEDDGDSSLEDFHDAYQVFKY